MRVINGGKSAEGQVVELKAKVAALEKERARLRKLLTPKKGDMTIAQGREFVELHSEARITCPCCDQKITPSQARPLSSFIKDLVKLEKVTSTKGDAEGWVRVHGLFSGGDYAKMKHWKFIEGAEAGVWRITDIGRAFLRGESSVREAAVLKGDRFIRFVGSEVVIRDLIAAKR